MNNADYKSPLSKEGPVLLTSSLVSDTKDDIMMELLQDLKSLLINTPHFLRLTFQLNISILFNLCFFISSNAPETRVIVLSGTHGTLAGESALSLQDERNVHQGFSFFVSDCQKVGIV